jgi:hypothetical protein
MKSTSQRVALLEGKLAEVRAADAALTAAVHANREFWGWAFNEMTDDQGEALNRLFNAVTALLRTAGEGK